MDIFLDDGGVMNDNQLRGGQWQRLVASFFAPRLGGAPERWMDANRVVAERLLGLEELNRRMEAATTYASFDAAYQLDWLRGMIELVGAAQPSDDECVALARQANRFITPRAVFVDDSPRAIAWAASAGARTVLVSRTGDSCS